MQKGVRLRGEHTHSPDTGQEPPSGEGEPDKQVTDRDAERDFYDVIACGFSGYRRSRAAVWPSQAAVRRALLGG